MSGPPFSATSLSSEDWQPACSVETLRIRAAMLKAVRQFFDARSYIEVETPLLSRDIVVDAHLHPFEVDVNGCQYFLQTSPEAGMKRLLAAGCGSIYQITRSFRKSERGTRHNPEFTIVEWYGVGTNHHQQMQLTEELVRCCLACSASESDSLMGEPCRPFDRISYEQAFQNLLGHSIHGLGSQQLLQLAVKAKIQLPESLATASTDDVLNVLLANHIEPHLGQDHPAFLVDYPLSQAALARQSPSNPNAAERFELYIRGVELCNGYHELSDPAELESRDAINNHIRHSNADSNLPGARRMMMAMHAGLPDCSGVALGFDRLVMLATGATCIDQVIPFPVERA